MVKLLLIYCLYLLVTGIMIRITKINYYKEFILPIYPKRYLSLSFVNIGKGKYRWELNLVKK